MTDSPKAASAAPIPPDDPARHAVHVRAEDKRVQHFSIVGDTYTILLTGEDTAGAYTLIDMVIPTGGGPPPHRHDFEEMFTVLEGEIEVTFRSQSSVARAGDTINIPANAPHRFTNAAERPARLLCMCTPPGQEEFFALIGDPVATRTSPRPEIGDDEQAERMSKALAIAPQYRTELLLP